MQQFIDKLISRLEEEPTPTMQAGIDYIIQGNAIPKKRVIEIVNKLAEQYKGGWIPCSERLPEVETTVLIHAKRKYRDGGFRDIITTAMYEDGTMLENDSKWRWEDIEGEWDEENDCYIIPEGWWEDKRYNEDGELNHAVDDVVLAWMPLPSPYHPEK